MIIFHDLWYGHPINQSVQSPCIAPRTGSHYSETGQIREGYPTFANQCAIRMGVSLRRAGVTPDQIGNAVTCGVHPVEEMHYIRAQQLADRLATASRSGRIQGLSEIERLTGNDPAEFYPKLFGRTGIIYIKDYWRRGVDRPGSPTGDHIDVWNGYRSSAKWLMEWFSWLGYYSNYAQAKEIWFWEVD